MARTVRESGSKDIGLGGLGGFMAGLGSLIERLGELAEKGEELNKSGEIRGPGPEGKLHGVYGISFRTGLGGNQVSIEPFGNIRKDAKTGTPVVGETREPMVDLFEEKDHVLVVAEMPGVGEADIRIELKDSLLTISAEKGATKYHQEVRLPRPFAADKMSSSCCNGILQIQLRE